MKKLFALMLLASLTAVWGCESQTTPAPESSGAENTESASTDAVQGTLVTLNVPNMT